MKIEKLDKNLKEKWRKLWQECKGSIYQSLEWAKIKEKCENKPIFITLEDKQNREKLRAGILAFERQIYSPFGKKRILTAEGNPLFLKKEDGIKILEEFKKQCKNYFYGTIAPTVINPCHEVFLAAGYKKVSNYTILINLTKPEEELFLSLEKKSARWGVKKAIKNNLVFEEAKKEDIQEFYPLYKKIALEGDFFAEPKEFLFSLLKKEIGKIFFVKKDRKIIAGGALLFNHDYTILNLTASNEEGQKLQAMPFLYWNLILFSKNLGKKYFDLGGYDKEAKEGEKTYNINKFKERFGGTITEQPIYSTNWRYPFLRKLIRKFKFLKNLYNKK